MYINEKTYISPVSKEIFEYKIGSYKVLHAFIKARKGKDLIDEISEIKSIIGALDKTVELIGDINSKFNSRTNFDTTYRGDDYEVAGHLDI